MTDHGKHLEKRFHIIYNCRNNLVVNVVKQEDTDVPEIFAGTLDTRLDVQSCLPLCSRATPRTSGSDHSATCHLQKFYLIVSCSKPRTTSDKPRHLVTVHRHPHQVNQKNIRNTSRKKKYLLLAPAISPFSMAMLGSWVKARPCKKNKPVAILSL